MMKRNRTVAQASVLNNHNLLDNHNLLGKNRLLIVFLALLLLSLLWQAQVALAGNLSWRGKIEAMPSGGLIGSWTVLGKTFTADASTRFDQENGALAVAGCANVEYLASLQAVRISSKPASDCTQSATGTPSGEANEIEVRGLVEQMPAGLLGDWTVNGKTYSTGPNTQFKPKAGAFAVGVCVAIHANTSTTPATIREIATVLTSVCQHANPTSTKEPNGTVPPKPTNTPQPPVGCDDDVQSSSDGKGGRDCRVYGRITELPTEGLIGEWSIDAIKYTVSEQTRLIGNHGGFAKDVCVRVEYKEANNTRTALRIRSDHAFKCDGDDHDNGRHGGELFGQIESMPDNKLGEWVIGGLSFVTDNTTEFKQERGTFAVGVTVKVKFFVDATDVNHAMKIETKFKGDHDGHDHDGNGSHDGALGMAFGKLESRPAAVAGDWVVDGVTYMGNADTELEEEKGALVAGARVRVRYHLDANGARIADNVKTLAAPGTVEAGEDAHLSGFVTEMPVEGLIGDWLIGNEAFVADGQSLFEEEIAVLAVGAYVEVEYKVEEGVKRIIELKTQTPPGAGDNGTIGEIQNTGGVAAAGVTAEVWQVAGQAYVVTAGTVLDDDNGNLSVGQAVVVNSYTAADGTEVATLIQSVAAVSRVYMPVMRR